MGINGDLTRKNGDRGYLDLLMMICYFPKGKSTTWGNFRGKYVLIFLEIPEAKPDEDAQ